MAASTLVPGASAVADGGLPLPAVFLHELLQALRTIRYGSIELVIHEGSKMGVAVASDQSRLTGQPEVEPGPIMEIVR
jgi:hypothetical protein